MNADENELDELLELACRTAVSAGELIIEHSKSGTSVMATKSSAVDIVTATDHASEEHITSIIRKARPNDSLLGEEGASHEGSTNVRWVFDPIDGTVNFLYGIPSYSVSVGAEVAGKPAVGAVYNPVTKELFRARSGGGAFLGEQRLAVRPAPPLDRALIATGFGYDAGLRGRQAQVLTQLLPLVRDIRRFGSAALDMCGVAMGRIDGYYEVGVKPWDVCAGLVIAAEAGARASTISGKPNEESIVVSHPALISELRRIINT